MPLVKWGIIGLILLPAAEMAAFVAVALLIGWILAVCLFLATTVLGLAILRRFGRRDIDRLRAAFRRDGLGALHLESPGMAPMLGAFLLIVPGFLTDLLGALMLLPAVRRWMLRQLIDRQARHSSDPRVVDLTPKEWHQVSEKPIKHLGPRKGTK